MSHQQLLAEYEELKKTLTFCADQSKLDLLLDQVGRNVDLLFTDLPDVSSVEEVTCRVTGTKMRESPLYGGQRVVPHKLTRKKKFMYLMLAGAGEELRPLEYRANLEGKPIDSPSLGEEFLLTSGFVGQAIHLHPQNQGESRFRYLGRTSKPKAHLIAFSQIPEKCRNIGLFKLPEHDVLILVQGLVWIDPDSFQVVRMRTNLLAPRNDIGLSEETTEIDFREVRFPFTKRTFWLPLQATVRVVFGGVIFRNRHLYSEHRLFRVETDYQVSEPE
jgi:hypothetical protein